MGKSILILYSNTGGGHRSVARAIRDALVASESSVGPEDIRLVDVFADYSRFPFNRFPTWYPNMIRYGSRLWSVGYRATDGRRRSRALLRPFRRTAGKVVRRLLNEGQPDVIVTVHPLLNTSIVWALGRPRPVFVTVIADLTNSHSWWYAPEADLCLVPTEDARRKAIRSGMDERKVRLTGFPVSASFLAALPDRETIRQELEWSLDRPVVLLSGGGAGIGPVVEVARKLSALRLDCELTILTGRNESLYERLRAESWKTPVHLYRFTDQIARLMKASDVLVTKAGPNSIMEACALGLPMVLVGAIPGQEEGNVQLVTEQGAGVWAPNPERAAQTVRRWIEEPASRRAASRAARQMAQPEAAARIAEEILACLP